MVPGDYYVARVRPTGWLLRPRVLPPVSPATALLSAVLLLRLSLSRTDLPIGADVRNIRGVCTAHLHTRARIHL